MNKLFQIKALAPASRVEDVILHLSENTPFGWQEEEREGGSILFTIHLEDTAAAEDIVQGVAAKWDDVSVERAEVENQDWALAWREFFTPVEAGATFIVLPPWMAEDAPEGRIPLLIEPKTAFGTGHHGTTALCLSAVAGLFEDGTVQSGDDFLDLGTGSGILGLGCCLLGMTGVGLDIDPLAIENAVENKALNNVGDAFALDTGSLDLLESGRTFRLVLANILANPLKAMARQLTDRVAPGGSLVLSGILTEQADDVAAVYQDLGLPEPRRETSAEWTALVWERLG